MVASIFESKLIWGPVPALASSFLPLHPLTRPYPFLNLTQIRTWSYPTPPHPQPHDSEVNSLNRQNTFLFLAILSFSLFPPRPPISLFLHNTPSALGIQWSVLLVGLHGKGPRKNVMYEFSPAPMGGRTCSRLAMSWTCCPAGVFYALCFRRKEKMNSVIRGRKSNTFRTVACKSDGEGQILF